MNSAARRRPRSASSSRRSGDARSLRQLTLDRVDVVRVDQTASPITRAGSCDRSRSRAFRRPSPRAAESRTPRSARGTRTRRRPRRGRSDLVADAARHRDPPGRRGASGPLCSGSSRQPRPPTIARRWSDRGDQPLERVAPPRCSCVAGASRRSGRNALRARRSRRPSGGSPGENRSSIPSGASRTRSRSTCSRSTTRSRVYVDGTSTKAARRTAGARADELEEEASARSNRPQAEDDVSGDHRRDSGTHGRAAVQWRTPRPSRARHGARGSTRAPGATRGALTPLRSSVGRHRGQSRRGSSGRGERRRCTVRSRPRR